MNIIVLRAPVVSATASLADVLFMGGSGVAIELTLGCSATTAVETLWVSSSRVGTLSVVGSRRGNRRDFRDSSWGIVLQDVKDIVRIYRLLAFHRAGCTNTTSRLVLSLVGLGVMRLDWMVGLVSE